MDSVFYTDVQVRWFAPSFADNFGFALGVNNLFESRTPGCFDLRSQQLRSDHLRRSGPLLLRPGQDQDVGRPPRGCQTGEGRSAIGRPPFSVIVDGGLNIAANLPM